MQSSLGMPPVPIDRGYHSVDEGLFFVVILIIFFVVFVIVLV